MVSISTLRRDAKQEANTAKKNIIRNICTRLKNIREENKGSVKHGLISTIIKTTVQAVPQYNITRHSIRHMQLKMAKEAKKDILKPSCDQQNTQKSIPSSSSFRKLGGRPEGATINKANNKLDSFAAARNEIATLFMEELECMKKKGMRMQKGRFEELVDKVKTDRSLPHSFSVSRETIRKRVAR